MSIRPSLRPRKRMRSRPKSQVRLAPPVFQVVLRLKPRLRPIRNLVVMIPRRSQSFLRHLIKLRHLIFARHSPSAVLLTTLQQFLPKPAALINLQQINRNMLRRKHSQLIQRVPPALLRLVRQTRNQIKADVPYPRLAQNRHRAVNIRPPVHPPRRNQFLVHERLQPKTDPVNPRPHPSCCLFRLNGLRVRLQRHLFQFRRVGPAWSLPRSLRGAGPLLHPIDPAPRGGRLGVRRLAAAFPTARAIASGAQIERFPNRTQYVLYMCRIQQTRRPPANVNRVHYCFVAQPLLAVRLSYQVLTTDRPHPSRLQKLQMLANFSAHRLNIGPKPAARHQSCMKITIRTLRLAERHLHVNPEFLHRPKTLAHPHPKLSLCGPPSVAHLQASALTRHWSVSVAGM